MALSNHPNKFFMSVILSLLIGYFLSGRARKTRNMIMDHTQIGVAADSGSEDIQSRVMIRAQTICDWVHVGTLTVGNHVFL